MERVGSLRNLLRGLCEIRESRRLFFRLSRGSSTSRKRTSWSSSSSIRIARSLGPLGPLPALAEATVTAHKPAQPPPRPLSPSQFSSPQPFPPPSTSISTSRDANDHATPLNHLHPSLESRRPTQSVSSSLLSLPARHRLTFGGGDSFERDCCGCVWGACVGSEVGGEGGDLGAS